MTWLVALVLPPCGFGDLLRPCDLVGPGPCDLAAGPGLCDLAVGPGLCDLAAGPCGVVSAEGCALIAADVVQAEQQQRR